MRGGNVCVLCYDVIIFLCNFVWYIVDKIFSVIELIGV